MAPNEKPASWAGQSFKNYFWTAQCMAGGAMAIKLGFQEGPLGALFGFFGTMPLVALIVGVKVALDLRRLRQPSQPPALRES